MYRIAGMVEAPSVGEMVVAALYQMWQYWLHECVLFHRANERELWERTGKKPGKTGPNDYE